MHMACWPQILVQDCGVASALCLMMLTYCAESGLGPIHVCKGTTVLMNTSRSGVWLGPLVGRRFEPRRGLIQGVQTIALTLVDLTPMWLSSSDTRGLNLQQEPSLEKLVYNKWPELVLPGECKPMQTHNVSLQEKEGPTPGANKIVLKKFFDKSGKRHN